MWCNTIQSAHDAVKTLKRSARVVLACEGESLGEETGRLSIISVATHDAKSIFLFDVRGLDSAGIQPLVEFLSSDQVPKIMWDGRREAIELRREFGTEIGRPWDLQLVDITSRKLRGDANERKDIKKQWHPLAAVAHMDLEGVHALTSINNVLKAHNIEPTSDIVRGTINHTLWLARPLSESYIRYAENEVRLIARIANVFMSRGYLPKITRPLLEEQSARYFSIDGRIMTGDEAFLASCILPMDVLGDIPGSGWTFQTCDKCQLSLDSSCFVYATMRDGRDVHSHFSCKVCNVLAELRRHVRSDEPPSQTQVSSAPKPRPNLQNTHQNQKGGHKQPQGQTQSQNQNQSRNRNQSQNQSQNIRGGGQSKAPSKRAASGQAPRRPPRASTSNRHRDRSPDGPGFPYNMSMGERKRAAEYALEKGWWAHADILDPDCMSGWDL